MHHKIAGYVLICAGLLLMLFSLVSMYKVFVDRQPVAPVVQLADMKINTQVGLMQLPMENINTMTNLGLFALFMLFILTAGGKVAALGCNFIKTERIYDALSQAAQRGKLPDEKDLKTL